MSNVAGSVVWHDEEVSDNARQAASALLLREYRSTDLEAVFRLDEICFTKEFRFSRASMRRFAEARHALALMAEVEASADRPAELAGFVIVHVEGLNEARRGYVVTLDVAPEHRRMGVAGRMMDAVEQRAASAGAGSMELHVFVENAAAIRFYEALGYVCLGVQPEFYGLGLDALVYRKQLKSG